MQHSKRSQESYLMVDHRNSPGLSDDQIFKIAVETANPGLPIGCRAGTGMFEAPTVTCTHCQRGVILNPLRNRDRAYCGKCDAYICDECGIAMKVDGVCYPWKQRVDDLFEQGIKEMMNHE